MGNLTRAERNIAWIEKMCRVPEGGDVGKPVMLRDWQKAFLRKVYDNKVPTRTAILSVGRKNGKTALISFIALLHLVGPEAKPNSQLYSAAQSQKQAAVVYNYSAKTVRMSPELRDFLILRDTLKEIACPELGTVYSALSAEHKTALGLSPILAIHDELGAVSGPRSPLYDAVETGMSAHSQPLSFVISTQAPTDADLLSVLIDDAMAGHDPSIVAQVYQAGEDVDPFSEEAIRQANPAFGDFQNAGEILKAAHKAQRMPSFEAEYRNKHLNQRVAVNSPFVSRSVWQACGGESHIPAGSVVYGGLDLSATTDLTAFVFVSKIDGIWRTQSKFWLPEEGLLEKAHADRVPYDQWQREGFLNTTPGKSINYDDIAPFIDHFFDSFDVRAIGFDRAYMRHFKGALERVGLHQEQIDRFREFGQGYVSMTPALRSLEDVLLNEKLAHGNHPVLSMCAATAIVTQDPAGNRKLDKSKSNGRIDGMVALTMALAVALEGEGEPETSFWEVA